MNPIRKHLEVHRTGTKETAYSTFNIHEYIYPVTMMGEMYEEYRFDARFGCRHMLRDDLDPTEKAIVLNHIKQDVIRKVNNELYGDIRESLYELRIKLYERDLMALANDVSKLIDETL